MTPYDWQSDPDLKTKTITRSAIELIEVGGLLLLSVLFLVILSAFGGPGEVTFQ